MIIVIILICCHCHQINNAPLGNWWKGTCSPPQCCCFWQWWPHGGWEEEWCGYCNRGIIIVIRSFATTTTNNNDNRCIITNFYFICGSIVDGSIDQWLHCGSYDRGGIPGKHGVGGSKDEKLPIFNWWVQYAMKNWWAELGVRNRTLCLVRAKLTQFKW